MYAHARPTFFFDPTGLESLAALAKRTREARTGDGRRIVSSGQAGQVAFDDTPVAQRDERARGDGVTYRDELGIDIDALADELGPPKPKVVIEESLTMTDHALNAVIAVDNAIGAVAEEVGERTEALIKKQRVASEPNEHRDRQLSALNGDAAVVDRNIGEKFVDDVAEVGGEGARIATREGIETAIAGGIGKLGRIRPKPLKAPKRGATVGKWTGKDVGGRTVYQRSDIFDPGKASSWQDPVSGQWKRGTNVERMGDGLAPIGRDGKSVNLHHVLQSEPGPLAEVPSSLHKRLPHKLRGPGESFRNDPALKQQFEDFRGEYWKQRSKDLTSGN